MTLAMMLAVSGLAGCGPTDAPSTDNNQTNVGGTETPSTNDKVQITMNLRSEPPELFATKTTDTVSGTVLRHVVENLVTLDAEDNVQPGVAESWTYDEQTLTYTFKLRKGGKWSTGQDVTANDFVYAWTNLVDPEFGAKYSYMGYVLKNGEAVANGQVALTDLGVKAIDDYTLEVQLERPTPYALSMFAFYVYAPINEEAHLALGDTYGKDAATLPTNGVFNMSEWVHESKIVLTKNTDHWRAADTDLDEITMLMITDSNAALNVFETGGAQLIGLTGTQAIDLRAKDREVLSYNDGSCWYFEFNHTQEGLNNAKIRQALTLGVDVDTFLVGLVKNEASKPATTFTPAAINGADGKFQDAAGVLIERGDFAKAKALLEEGMAEEGLTELNLTLLSDDGDTAAKQCAYFQEQWKTNLGLDVKVELLPFKSRLAKQDAGEYGIMMSGWGPDYNDPMTFLDMWVTGGGNNNTGYANPAYDELISKAAEEKDVHIREQLLIAAEKIIANDMPVGPIYHRAVDYIVAPGYTGVIRTAFQDINLLNVKYSK